MVSKILNNIRAIRLSYMWRIFIPTVTMVWMLMAGILVYQFQREKNYRRELVDSQLRMINNSIINAYNSERNLTKVLSFMNDFTAETMFDEIRVSIYDENGRLIDFLGHPIPSEINGEDPRSELEFGPSDDLEAKNKHLYFYTATKSDDGKLYVRTALPYSLTLAEAMGNATGWWVFIFVLGVVCSIIVYLATRMLTRNIMLLHDFATRAAEGQSLNRVYEFSRDELGDISRQIVSLYRSRHKAIEAGEREHQIALHAVEEKARIKNQLTNNINHELKTPIGIIKGYIDTILSDPEMSEPTRRKFLERTQSNIDRLCMLLNDVSTMTRLEDGGEKIPLSEIDFHDLVFQLHNDFQSAAHEAGIEFTYDIPIGCKVSGNHNVLTSMISNLIRNAMMHSHGTAIELQLIGQSDDFYIFSFADNGIGVPKESLSHLFERFYRVDTGRSRKAGGSGLGLPIVRNSVVLLGGSISVKNRSTGGLEFIFSLPKWHDAQHVEPTAESESPEDLD